MAPMFFLLVGTLAGVFGLALFVKKGLQAIEFIAGRLVDYVAWVKQRAEVNKDRKKTLEDEAAQKERLQEVGNAFAVAVARLDAYGANETEFPLLEDALLENDKVSKPSIFMLTLAAWCLLGAKRANAMQVASTVFVAKLLFLLIALILAAIPVIGGGVHVYRESQIRTMEETAARVPADQVQTRSDLAAFLVGNEAEQGSDGVGDTGAAPTACSGSECNRQTAACSNSRCEAHEDCESCPEDCGQCCTASSYWEETPVSEVVEGLQAEVATDIRVEAQVRERAAEVEMRICKDSGIGLFENEAMAVKVRYIGAFSVKPQEFEFRAQDERCSEWRGLGQVWKDGDEAMIHWKMVSPASSYGDWDGAVEGVVDGAFDCVPVGMKTGTCFFGSFELHRTCKPL